MTYIMASWLFSDAFSEIVKILLTIDSIIYWITAQLLTFAIDVASSEFVLYDITNAIIDRAYIIAGVFALFIMSYALIKGLFDPDGVFKGKNSVGSIVKNLIIAIALVALMPTIFQYMFRFQSIVVENNVIGAVILGNDGGNLTFKGKDSSSVTITPDNVGYNNYVKISANNMAFAALNCFVYSDNNDETIELYPDKVNRGTYLTPGFSPISTALGIKDAITKLSLGDDQETTFNAFKSEIVLSGNFLRLNLLSYNIATGGQDGEHIHYIYIVSTIAGIVMLVLAFTFCVNLVIRMFNLFLLEIISPIASFSLVIPNSKIFDTWLKATLKEYLDLFIRLVTLFLAVLIFSYFEELVNQVHNVKSNFNVLNILFVIGLLIFINEAPKLVKDIFGIKDDKKSIKDRLFTGAVAKTVGGALGLAAGGYAIGSGISHALRDTDPEIGKGKKAINALVGGARGIGVGKSASKSKNLGDFTGAINKGMEGTDAARQKSNLYYKQHGANPAGVIAGKFEDAWTSFAGGSPTVAYDRYKEQENRIGDIKKSIDGLNDIADEKDTISKLKKERDSFESSKQQRGDYIKSLSNDLTNKIDRSRNKIADYNNQLAITTDDSARASIIAARDKEQTLLEKYDKRLDNLDNRQLADIEYKNYLVDFENELQAKEMAYKTARSNYINEQAKVTGSKINLEVNKINRDLVKEANARNEFMRDVSVQADISSIDNIDKYFDDIKDEVYGKKQYDNLKERAYGIDEAGNVDWAAIQAKFKDTGMATVMGERKAKTWYKDSTTGESKYRLEDAAIGSLVKSIARSIVPNYDTLSKADQKVQEDQIRLTFNDSKSDALAKLAQGIRDNFNARVVNDVVAEQNANATIVNIMSTSGLADKGLSVDDLAKVIYKMNAGTSRGKEDSTKGSVGTIHESADYLNAKQAYEEAYEQKKEGK